MNQYVRHFESDLGSVFFLRRLIRQLMLQVRSERKLTLVSSWGRAALYINTPLVIHAEASSCDVWITNRATESLGQNSLDSMVWFSRTLESNKPTLMFNMAECRFSTNSHGPSTDFTWSIYCGLRNLTDPSNSPTRACYYHPHFEKEETGAETLSIEHEQHHSCMWRNQNLLSILSSTSPQPPICQITFLGLHHIRKK